MKFIPRQPRDGINVSDEHPLKEAAVLVVGLSAIFLFIALVLVFIVDFVILAISPETEARMFSDWTPVDIVVESEDRRAEDVEQILRRLETHWPDREYTTRVIVASDEVPNALALPGGAIVVTTGLLDIVESENEFAFILGHELGHFRNRDHLRGIGRGVAFSLLFAALGSSDGADLGYAVADLTLRGFSREQENDADRFGLELLQAEYGHVADAWRFFERLREMDDEAGALQTYLSTHPQTNERIDSIIAYARSMNWRHAGPTTRIDWQTSEPGSN